MLHIKQNNYENKYEILFDFRCTFFFCSLFHSETTLTALGITSSAWPAWPKTFLPKSQTSSYPIWGPEESSRLPLPLRTHPQDTRCKLRSKMVPGASLAVSQYRFLNHSVRWSFPQLSALSVPFSLHYGGCRWTTWLDRVLRTGLLPLQAFSVRMSLSFSLCLSMPG